MVQWLYPLLPLDGNIFFLGKKQATEYCKNLFLQGLEIVFRVGLAILQMNQTELIQLDMEGMLQVNQPSKVCTAPTTPEAQTSTTPT